MRVPQRFQYDTGFVTIRGCVIPWGKCHWGKCYWKFHCNDPAIEMPDTLDREELDDLFVELVRLHDFKWLENPNDFPGEVLERELPSDEQCVELIKRLSPDFLYPDFVSDLDNIQDWYKTLTADSSAE